MTAVLERPPAQGAGPEDVTTPTVRSVARRVLFWVVVAIVALLIALLVASLSRNAAVGEPLASDNPAPGGSMALAEVLRQQGVDVTATATIDDTVDAVGDPAATTILLYDPFTFLDDDQLAQVAGLANRLVLVDPSFDQLQELAPAVAQAGTISSDLTADGLTADCALPAVRKAETVSGEAYGYRIVDEDSAALGCLEAEDDVYALVELDGLTVLGTVGALTNGEIAQDGNAALVLNLLGEHADLVWYLPSFADVDSGGGYEPPPSPAWLIPAVALLFGAGIAAAFWRGRRFGPLVVENLPVTVRASETMLGRARLYEKSRARLRALDALRVGAAQRIAKLAGLSRHATLDEIVAATAALTGRPATDIRRLLVDDEPASDTDLVQRSDELITLEREVQRAVRGR